MKLSELIHENKNLVQDANLLKEELNLYKGKCATLSRDIEMQQTYLSKVNNDHLGNSE